MTDKLIYSDTRNGRLWRVDLLGLSYRVCDDPAREAAELIADGKIVGWFMGRSEFGPRALGHRSILADPRRKEMHSYLNDRIKHRQWFRPYAPAVLAEEVSVYFELDAPSPHMLLVAAVREEWKGKLPAITHADGTARIQTVTREDNGLFYEVVKAFKELTGIGVILNTSFNDHGEPIVQSPSDALANFTAVDMDALVMEGVLITKQDKAGEAR